MEYKQINWFRKKANVKVNQESSEHHLEQEFSWDNFNLNDFEL
jgi:hypothetical protein